MAEGERIDVTDEPTLLFSCESSDGATYLLRRLDGSSGTIDLGGEEVASGEGVELQPDEDLPLVVPYGETLYGVLATGTAEVQVLRIG